MSKLWPDSYVEESNLTQNVYMLRRALGEGSHEHRYIVTIPGRGYRFNAEIRESSQEGAEMMIETRTLSRIIIPPEESTRQEMVARSGQPGARSIQLSGGRPGRAAVVRGAVERHKTEVSVALGVVILAIAGAIFFHSSSTKAATPQFHLPRLVPFKSDTRSESEATFTPNGSQIAFVGDGGTERNFDIYVKLLDVGNPLRLTTDPAMDPGPVWSPDGRFIAFMRRQSIGTETVILIPALGGPERRVAQVADGLDWSPDGQYLLVADKSSPGEPNSISLLSIETGERRKLTAPPIGSFGDTLPVFSPDGKTIAFARQISGGVEELYVVPLAGGEPRQLTSDNRRIYSLQWARSGREIIFSS